VLQDVLILSIDNISESWVVYSRASFHDTPDRKHFLDYVQGDFRQVHLGDDAPCKILGMGKVKINQRNGKEWSLKVVRHVGNTNYTESEGGEQCRALFSKLPSYTKLLVSNLHLLITYCCYL
jgi:hypothetical protein